MNYFLQFGIIMFMMFHASESGYMTCKSRRPRCPPGYRQHRGDCIDIDECENEPCTEPYTECVNTQGGYNCTCCEGYEYVEEHYICRPKECPEGWEPFGSNCYQFRDKREFFDDAESDCQLDGAHLMSISNREEKYYNEKVLADLKANGNTGTIFWTGLARIGNLTQINAFTFENLKPYFEWSNGEDYTGFPMFQVPRLYYGDNDRRCASIWGNKEEDTWIGTCLYSQKVYRCQRDKDNSGSCGDWFEVNDYCYHKNTVPNDDPIRVYYSNATEVCDSMGGRLPIFRDGDNMTALLDQGIAGWIGLESNGRAFDRIIARGMSEFFRWTDGTPNDKTVIYLKRFFELDDENVNIGYFMFSNQEPYYNPSLTTNRLPYICEKPL